jgi:hypothetical protein
MVDAKWLNHDRATPVTQAENHSSDPTRNGSHKRDRVDPLELELSGAEKYSTQRLNTVTRENSIRSASSALFLGEAAAGGGLT